MRCGFALLFALTFMNPAWADPLDEKAARKMLFPANGFKVVYKEESGLTETQLGYFKLLVKGRESRNDFKKIAHYYGAIAISPSIFEGTPADLLRDPKKVPFRMETGLHSVEAAQTAVLSACNKLVNSGKKPCVVAALIVPKRYKPVDLTLSVFATQAFKDYRKAKGPKAFAISPRSKGFGISDGDSANAVALAECNATAKETGKADCEIVILDAD